jgi:hypothetical protein
VIARLAVALAWSSAPEHRWRRAAVPITAALGTVVLLAAASTLALVLRERERVAGRAAAIAEVPHGRDLVVVERDDVVDRRQFPVVWLEPATDEEPIRPPGVGELPRAGEAVVSPALDAAARADPVVAARYPRRSVIGDAGIRDEGELLAYRRPSADRELAGDERAIRVAGFGVRDARRTWEIGDAASVSLAPAVEGVFALLVLPALLLLAAGVNTGSRLRDQRFATLGWLGASRRVRIKLAVAETALLATPGIALATAVWGFAAPRIDALPIVDHNPVEGDFGLPWWALASLALLLLFVVGAMAAAAPGLGRDRAPRPRPTPRSGSVSLLRTIPFGLAGGLVLLGVVSGGRAGATAMLGGFVLGIAALPLVLPIVLGPVARAIRASGSVAALIASRRLESDPIRTARPFAAVGILVALAIAGIGYIALLRHDEVRAAPSDGPSGVVVRWLDPAAADVDRLARSLTPRLVVPLDVADDVVRIGASCPRVATFVGGSRCEGREASVATDVLRAAGLRAVAARFDPEPGRVADSALVIAKEPIDTLDQRARTAAALTLPAPSVFNPRLRQPESPLTAWITGGLSVAFASLALAALILLVDRLVAAPRERRQLAAVGLAGRRLHALEVWQFAAPYAAIVGASAVVGFAMCALLLRVGGNVEIPWSAIAETLGLAVAAGTAGSLLTAGLVAAETGSPARARD